MEYNEEILEKCLPKYLEEDLKQLKEGENKYVKKQIRNK